MLDDVILAYWFFSILWVSFCILIALFSMLIINKYLFIISLCITIFLLLNMHTSIRSEEKNILNIIDNCLLSYKNNNTLFQYNSSLSITNYDRIKIIGTALYKYKFIINNITYINNYQKTGTHFYKISIEWNLTQPLL
jgi:hypothetical protein